MAKTPRIDPYHRLIFRLYEALFFLHILGPIRGPGTVINLDFSTDLGIRRRFLSNLAFLCDYAKGGLSTTAIAVENAYNGNLFWISSNEGTSQRVVVFLKSFILSLKEFHLLPRHLGADAKHKLLQASVRFSDYRIRKQAKALANTSSRCQAWLIENNVAEEVASWLQQFELFKRPDLVTACQEAWRIRDDPEMNLLQRLGSEHAFQGKYISSETRDLFKKTRHLIGRLAAYVRACEELLEDSNKLEYLLDVFDVNAVVRPTSVPRPQADEHTNLNGILKRMLPTNDSRFPILSEYLRDIDSHTRLEYTLIDKFNNPKETAPCVHAEIQMLHHFHDNNLAFFNKDSYIATSKPACFCCKLYFRHHPAGAADLASHEKVYPHWGPILLAQGRHDSHWMVHREVLQKVIKYINQEIIQELEQRRTRMPYHADTLTALTAGNRLAPLNSMVRSNRCDSDGPDGPDEDDVDSDPDGGVRLW